MWLRLQSTNIWLATQSSTRVSDSEWRTAPGCASMAEIDGVEGDENEHLSLHAMMARQKVLEKRKN